MSPESEHQTRKQRIDTRLRASGWSVRPYAPHAPELPQTPTALEEYPTLNGPADYALVAGGRLLGIVEAKKVSVSPQNVLEQAKRYAAGLPDTLGQWDGLCVPFLYATNGEGVWFLDARDIKCTSRAVTTFHTPGALLEQFGRDRPRALRWFIETPIERIARLRPYQQRAIQATETAVLAGRRNILLAMATGTGKTFNTVAQIYRLLESGYARRVLFLVDRKALAAQAVREFAAFQTPNGMKFDQEYEVYSQRFRKEDFGEDEPFNPKVLPTQYLTAPSSTHTFVYVSTIQRMTINLFGWRNAYAQSASDPDIEEEAETMDIPIHAFDVIIADECHRGYTAAETAVWRDTLMHFDALRIGLTATPAAHTVALLGEPAFRYTVEQAVQDGYLVDYDAVAIRSRVRLQGAFLKPGEVVARVDTETGEQIYDELEDERTFSAEDIERQITAPDSNRRILAEVAKYAAAHEQETGRFPKTLIFAVNDLPHTSHADQLVQLCRELFNQGDAFVQKITGNPNVDRPLQRIREFRNRPNPKVVVTVDMLSTGVDIPCLEFIVFLRPVKSRILWEQMLGRGTRRCADINKSHFTVFDCFDGTLFEYFRNVSAFQMDALQKEAIPIAQVIENIYQNIDRAYFVRVLVRRLRRVEKDMSAKAREAFAAHIPDGNIGRLASELPERVAEDFAHVMKVLRNPAFQELLVNYERAKRAFLIGYGVTDEVTSEPLFASEGGPLKPEDYLSRFNEFIRGHESEIDAIQVLLHKPKHWRTDKLDELRQRLRAASYDERSLQQAHELVHHKALADIISMVKHAAREQEPILTAAERVDRALAKVRAGRSFTPEQERWLGLIREHLVNNLTIEWDDFSALPIFDRQGGIAKASSVFGASLKQLVQDLNEALVS